MDEIILLNRIRGDIGEYSGPIAKLLSLASLKGFNDNYEPQEKPRLVGTWIINDLYTTTQVAQAQAIFDGLAIVADPNYLIDFSQLAVQVLDPNEDNYNPAVAIILQGQNLGTTMEDAPSGHGRWFITKNDAANLKYSNSYITQRYFRNKTTVSDVNNIIDGNDYQFTTFNEAKYFTLFFNSGIEYTQNGGEFQDCKLLEEVTLPETLLSLHYLIFANCTNLRKVTFSDNLTVIGKGAFSGCTNLRMPNLPQTITHIYGGAFYNTSSSFVPTEDELININLPNLTYFGENSYSGNNLFYKNKCIKSVTSLGSTITQIYYYSFQGCVNLESVILPQTVTVLGVGCFAECTKLSQINLTNITTIGTGSLGGTNLDISVLSPNLQRIEDNTSYGFASKVKSFTATEIPESLVYIGRCCFYEMKKTDSPYLHFSTQTAPELGGSGYNGSFGLSYYTIYIGLGTSQEDDQAMIDNYKQQSTVWAEYINNAGSSSYYPTIDTWYNYLHPTT